MATEVIDKDEEGLEYRSSKSGLVSASEGTAVLGTTLFHRLNEKV
jgi:hypothetical protein